MRPVAARRQNPDLRRRRHPGGSGGFREREPPGAREPATPGKGRSASCPESRCSSRSRGRGPCERRRLRPVTVLRVCRESGSPDPAAAAPERSRGEVRPGRAEAGPKRGRVGPKRGRAGRLPAASRAGDSERVRGRGLRGRVRRLRRWRAGRVRRVGCAGSGRGGAGAIPPGSPPVGEGVPERKRGPRRRAFPTFTPGLHARPPDRGPVGEMVSRRGSEAARGVRSRIARRSSVFSRPRAPARPLPARSLPVRSLPARSLPARSLPVRSHSGPLALRSGPPPRRGSRDADRPPSRPLLRPAGARALPPRPPARPALPRSLPPTDRSGLPRSAAVPRSAARTAGTSTSLPGNRLPPAPWRLAESTPSLSAPRLPAASRRGPLHPVAVGGPSPRRLTCRRAV